LRTANLPHNREAYRRMPVERFSHDSKEKKRAKKEMGERFVRVDPGQGGKRRACQ